MNQRFFSNLFELTTCAALMGFFFLKDFKCHQKSANPSKANFLMKT